MTRTTARLLDPDHRVLDLLDVTCPTCDALPGEDCLVEQPHLARVEVADDATVPGATPAMPTAALPRHEADTVRAA